MKPGRNDSCLCGSGKKYKNCCQGKSAKRTAILPAQQKIDAAAPKYFVKEAAPGSAEYNQLVDTFNAGHYAELESQTRSLLERYPDFSVAWKMLGSALRMQGKDSLTVLQKVTELLPDDAEEHYNLGDAFMKLGRLDEAEACYRRVLQIKPDLVGAHINLGILFKKLGRLDEAEACYRQVLRVKPDLTEAHYNLGVLFRMQGRLDEAEASYRQVLQVKPDFAVAHNNLGATLKDLGRLDEAEASYRRALQIRPDFVEAHYNLGNTLAKLGRLHQAEACYRQLLELKPGFAEAHNNLGDMLKGQDRLLDAEASYRQALELKADFSEAGINLGNMLKEQDRIPEAVACYMQVLEFKPDFADAHNHLGIALGNLGRLDEAVASCRQALELKPDFAEAHCSLARLLTAQNQPMMALAHYRKALLVAPRLLDAQHGISNILSRVVPGWHVPMMNEQNRNNAYFSALQAAITPDSAVFEIGTGSGLLSMMAAKLGACQVTTCEAEPLIAKTAQCIVADNGYEKVIKVLAKPSVKVQVGEDMPAKADILVSEIFSSELLGEHVLPCIEDAKRRLLKPQGRVIPAAGSIMVALFSGSDIRRNLIVEDSFGFNLQRFNTVISERLLIDRHDLNIEMLTEGAEAFRFDFENESFFPSQSRTLRIPITSPGRCYGIIQWIRLQMDEETTFENHPSEKSPVSNWRHCAYVFPEPVDVKPGQVAVVSAAHNRVVPWFYLDGIESA